MGVVDWRDKFGESAWGSCFYLDKLPENTVVFHQTRDTLKVLRAFIRIEFFEKAWPYSVWGKGHTEDFSSLDKYDKYLYWYLKLNKLIECRNVERYKIEDINETILLNMCNEILHDVSWDSCSKAIKETKDKTYSHATPEDDLITWDTFPKSELKEKVQDMAVRYGYVIS